MLRTLTLWTATIYSALGAVERTPLEQALRDDDHAAAIGLILSELNGGAEMERTWRRVLEREGPKQATLLTWAERLRWHEQLQQHGIELAIDPRGPEALREGVASSDPASRITALEAAADARVPLTDAHRLQWYTTALELGDAREAARALAWLTGSQYRDNALHTAAFEHNLPPPRVRPQLVFHSLLGGEGKQAFTSLDIDANGIVTARGNGLELRVDPSTGASRSSGNLNTDIGDKKLSWKPGMPKGWHKGDQHARQWTDTRNGQTITFESWQNHKDLIVPWVQSDAGWELWGWSYSECKRVDRMADCYIWDVWPTPDGGLAAALGSVDTNYSILVKHPTNLGRRGNISGTTNGYQTMIVRIDPSDGAVSSTGIIWPGSLSKYRIDPWGNMFLANHEGSNNAALVMFDAALSGRPTVIPIGGRESSRDTRARSCAIARRGPWLAIAGFARAASIRGVNALQTRGHRDGQGDAFLAIFKLW